MPFLGGGALEDPPPGRERAACGLGGRLRGARAQVARGMFLGGGLTAGGGTGTAAGGPWLEGWLSC